MLERMHAVYTVITPEICNGSAAVGAIGAGLIRWLGFQGMFMKLWVQTAVMLHMCLVYGPGRSWMGLCMQS